MQLTNEMLQESSTEEMEILNEAPEVVRAQLAHLKRRVVQLRALCNAQEAELKTLREENVSENDPDTVEE